MSLESPRQCFGDYVEQEYEDGTLGCANCAAPKERHRDQLWSSPSPFVRRVIGACNAIDEMKEKNHLLTDHDCAVSFYGKMEKLEAKLRRELWVNHGHDFIALYGDDGEMQCGQCAPAGKWDFKRMPINDLIEHVGKVRHANGTDAMARIASSNFTALELAERISSNFSEDYREDAAKIVRLLTPLKYLWNAVPEAPLSDAELGEACKSLIRTQYAMREPEVYDVSTMALEMDLAACMWLKTYRNDFASFQNAAITTIAKLERTVREAKERLDYFVKLAQDNEANGLRMRDEGNAKIAALRSALEAIRDGYETVPIPDPCHCDHATPDCCARADQYCPQCYAAVALMEAV